MHGRSVREQARVVGVGVGGQVREQACEVGSGDGRRCQVKEQCGRRWWAKERGWSCGDGCGCAQSVWG
jgi:hypothetical protein